MNITIDYESSWRNSFLEGTNNEPLPKKGRAFVGSSQKLKSNDTYYIQRQITIDTVLGVLNRLIGDQRKLYQTRQAIDAQHYFETLIPNISFEDSPSSISQETVFIRNMTGNTDQNKFSGVVSTSAPIFTSEYSPKLWGVLALEIPDLIDFIINDKESLPEISLNPLHIINRFTALGKMKLPKDESKELDKAVAVLEKQFPDYNPLTAKGIVKVVPMYCSSLYLQLQRLEQKGHDLSTAKTKAGLISGISKNNITAKDFMKLYTSGGQKLVYGNPYVKETIVKGEGRVKHTLKKASGQLHITIDVDRQKAQEIESLILAAGVSSFYLGKKGLAFVSSVRT